MGSDLGKCCELFLRHLWLAVLIFIFMFMDSFELSSIARRALIIGGVRICIISIDTFCRIVSKFGNILWNFLRSRRIFRTAAALSACLCLSSFLSGSAHKHSHDFANPKCFLKCFFVILSRGKAIFIPEFMKLFPEISESNIFSKLCNVMLVQMIDKHIERKLNLSI